MLRLPKLCNCVDPFPKPSVTSSAAIRSGSVKLSDGLTIKVDDYQQDITWKISERFALDEIEAFVLLRSFLYNEQYHYAPSSKGADADVEAALLDSITDFYFEERLFLLRLLPPLYRAQADDSNLLHDLATEILHEAAPDPSQYIKNLIANFVRRTKQVIPVKPPPNQATTPLSVRSKWAKQIVREQICILEVIFFATYNMRSQGSLVADFYEAIYSTSLGAAQTNAESLIDLESEQLLKDLESLAIITAVQVLCVEALYDQELDLDVVSSARHGYLAEPKELERMHKHVLSTPPQPRFSPIVLAWTCVVRRVVQATENDSYPQEYSSLVSLLVPERDARDATWQDLTRVALNPAMDIFGAIQRLLVSPLLDTEVAAKQGSSIIFPNDNVVRAIVKGLVIGLMDLIRVEYIEDIDSLLDIWVLLFGSGEWQSVAPLCADFWQVDFPRDASNRRALLEMTRDRFPVQARPFVRILRSLTATGNFKGLEGYVWERELDNDRAGCALSVFNYFNSLMSFTQVVVLGKPEQQGLFEVRNFAGGTVYTNTRPLRLPGGSILAARSQGTVISDAEEGAPLVVLWQHNHSGWKIALALLKEYVKIKQVASGGARSRFGPLDRGIGASGVQSQLLPYDLSFGDLGIDEGSLDQDVITDVLELLRSVFRNNHLLTETLMETMLPEHDGSSSGWGRASLIEVIPFILQEALHSTSLSNDGLHSPTKLVTNILGLMTAILPHHPGSVWTSLRNSTPLFGSSRHRSSTPNFLAHERQMGAYPMTLALLELVRALLDESVRMMYEVTPSFRVVKTEVLLRALSFVHNEIWIEYNGWKYLALSEKFEIGSKIANLFADILVQAPSLDLQSDLSPTPEDTSSTLSTLAKFVMDAFFVKSLPNTVTPLVNAIATGQGTRESLHKARRFNDAHHLDLLIEVSVHLTRLILVRKSGTPATKTSLLEQGLLTGALAGAITTDQQKNQLSPLDIVARHFTRSPHEHSLKLESIKLLTTLCVSISSCHPSPPSILGRLSDPEDVVKYFISIVQHADDESSVRLAAWNFISTSIETQPPLASFFLTGKAMPSTLEMTSRNPSASSSSEPPTALEAARETLARWNTLWEANPAILATCMSFLDLLWQHGHEHVNVIEDVRKDEKFWGDMKNLIDAKLGPVPSTDVMDLMDVEGQLRSTLNEIASSHSYQTVVKAHAIHLIALDLSMPDKRSPLPPFSSFHIITKLLDTPLKFTEAVEEAMASPVEPTRHLRVQADLEAAYPLMPLESLRAVALVSERVFGDDYLFPSLFVEERLHNYYTTTHVQPPTSALIMHKLVLSLNLEWSLIDSHMNLTRSWSKLLHFARKTIIARKDSYKSLFASATSFARLIAGEARAGPVIVAVHSERLAILLALLEAMLPYEASAEEVHNLIVALECIVSLQSISPLQPLSRLVQPEFQQLLLQICYFCCHKARSAKLDKLPAAKRSSVIQAVGTILRFCIDGLRIVLEQARSVDDPGLDEDLSLLVSVFEECIRPEHGSSQSLWLSQLQASNSIRLSLEVLSKADLTGEAHPATIRSRQFPYYARHVLHFHLALASLPSSAERLAHEGAMSAYASNSLTSYLGRGSVEVYDISHRSWCSILAIVTSLILALGSGGTHFVKAEIVGFVQLYGSQLSKVLSWRVGDALSTALVRELEATTALFNAIAVTTSQRHGDGLAARDILRAYSEKALFLLQQLNAAVSYPNQVASSLDPLDPAEHSLFEQELTLGSVSSSIEFLDDGKRPILASFVQKFVSVSATTLATLAIVGGSDAILMRHEFKSIDTILTTPSSKISPDEPATVGTLVELGNWVVQLLSHLLKRPSSPISVISSAVDIAPFDRSTTVKSLASLIEKLMVYATTQLSRWLERDLTTDSDAGILTQTNGREDMDTTGTPKGTRGGRITLIHAQVQSAVQDQARDLSLLATRAKEVLGKMASDDEGSALILLEILIGFTSAKLLPTPNSGR
ncbi:uncharacterized protein EI90DRAFT_2934390 [Cantharellus anzutake]|uniref:uncharacterized protein n=1 Tax=Cantharellus anzutake TaxID=1750568 RepID=UPI0019057602|nr:uncharacterized protein EI90DRAFT_2934390 [Cantharellus anzutake]KAF8324583.1 hypothetical protein EI90DRAFT_2934390 [Cantharellus anzutake]